MEDVARRHALERGAALSGRPKNPSFEQLVEAVGDFAIYMLDPEGRVVTWSAAAERINGWRREEVEGRSFSRFFTSEDQRAGLPETILARAREEGRFQSEGWRLRKDGGRFWAQASVHAIRAEDGAVAGFAKITRDMTERREAQLKLEEMQKQLAESQKLDAVKVSTSRFRPGEGLANCAVGKFDLS